VGCSLRLLFNLFFLPTSLAMTTLYLTEPGTTVQYQNANLTVKQNNQSLCLRMTELDLVVILPGVQLSSVVLSHLLDQGVETLFLKQNGQFRGRLQGSFATNPEVRLAQYRSVDTPLGLDLARLLMLSKVRNQRALLQRRNRETQGSITELTEAIDLLAAYTTGFQRIDTPITRNGMMGVEGICARVYYQALRHWFPEHWGFTGRNRQPPRDPINALLSWGYGVLASRMFVVCVQAGFDPYIGFFHAIEPYRPNLVLDLMEEFRPVVVDQAVITMIQAGTLTPEDFEPAPDGEGIWLGALGKKLFLAELERQLTKVLLYPPQDRRLSVSQIMLEQARWVGRCLVSQNLEYEGFVLK
jgi:CRISPR-associated protein Cas1